MPSLAEIARLNHRNNRSETADADILATIRRYDPNATWNETGSNDGYGYQLSYDPSKLPRNAVNNERGAFGTVPVYDDRTQYRRPDLFRQDENYGEITDSSNYAPPQDFLDRYGPMIGPALVGIVAPWAAGAMAAAGIGGGAGLTSAVTGSGLTGGASNWLSQLGARAPNLARSASRGDWMSILTSALNAGGSALGLPSGTGSAASTLASLARRKP